MNANNVVCVVYVWCMWMVGSESIDNNQQSCVYGSRIVNCLGDKIVWRRTTTHELRMNWATFGFFQKIEKETNLQRPTTMMISWCMLQQSAHDDREKEAKTNSNEHRRCAIRQLLSFPRFEVQRVCFGRKLIKVDQSFFILFGFELFRRPNQSLLNESYSPMANWSPRWLCM